jgi:hypothetical protein
MSLVSHLLAADVRRFRSTLVSWIALVLITKIVDAVIPELAPDSAMAVGASFAASLLWIAMSIFFIALIAVVVQNHSLVGTTAFWFGRPIPPANLLASKLVLLLAVLVIVPVACDVAFMIAYRVPLMRLLAVVVQGLLLRTLFVAVIMCLAAVTANLTRFTLACVGAVTGLGVAGAMYVSVELRQATTSVRLMNLGGGGATGIAARAFDHTPEVLAALFLTLAAVAMLRSQYLRRSVRHSVSIGGACALAAIVVAAVWPWAMFVPREAEPSWAKAAGAAAVSGDPAGFRFDRVWSQKSGDLRLARADAHVSGVPEDWVATARLTGASLAVPGHADLASSPHGYAAPLVDQKGRSLIFLALQKVIGVQRVTSTGTAGADRIVAFVTRNGDLASRQPNTGDYSGKFVLELTQLERAAVMPLQPGTFQDGDFRIQLQQVRTAPDDDGLFVRAKISETETMLDRRPTLSYLYFLVNYERDEAISGYVSGAQRSGLLGPFSPSYWFPQGFTIETTSMRFSIPGAVRGASGREFQSGWVENAKLVLVKATALGAVTRELQLSNVTTIVEQMPVRRQ